MTISSPNPNFILQNGFKRLVVVQLEQFTIVRYLDLIMNHVGVSNGKRKVPYNIPIPAFGRVGIGVYVMRVTNIVCGICPEYFLRRTVMC